MASNGWCPHAKENEQCVPCDTHARKAQEAIRKKHGPDCTCYLCDNDGYWRHLGKQ